MTPLDPNPVKMNNIAERGGERRVERVVTIPLGIAVDRYLNALADLGFVQTAVAVLDHKQSRVQIVQILEDGKFPPAKDTRDHFRLLRAQEELLRAGPDAVNEFTTVTPADLPKLQEQWEAQGVTPRPISIKKHRFVEKFLRGQ